MSHLHWFCLGHYFVCIIQEVNLHSRAILAQRLINVSPSTHPHPQHFSFLIQTSDLVVSDLAAEKRLSLTGQGQSFTWFTVFSLRRPREDVKLPVCVNTEATGGSGRGLSHLDGPLSQ